MLEIRGMCKASVMLGVLNKFTVNVKQNFVIIIILIVIAIKGCQFAHTVICRKHYFSISTIDM